jgi:hypothetical protein
MITSKRAALYRGWNAVPDRTRRLMASTSPAGVPSSEAPLHVWEMDPQVTRQRQLLAAGPAQALSRLAIPGLRARVYTLIGRLKRG